MYKLLFIDIDGTLLTSDHQITQKTLASIKRVSSIKKMPVILITARPPQAVKDFYFALNISSPVVCFNGALILKDLGLDKGPSVLQSINIAPKFLEQVYVTAVENKVNISFYSFGEWITDYYEDWVMQEENITGTKVGITDMRMQIKIWVSENYGPHKILLMGETGEVDSISQILKSQTNNQLSIYKSKDTYLEIMNVDASKKTAIEYLLKQYNVTSKEIIAIGDNYNDIEMLQMAGLGIAMGNAPKEVKAYADYITLNNDSDGISFALEQFIV
ncbi:Cof-type HAD-IIB family hydrolase [Ferruginibacter sp.]|nr:HAD family phosphatase [Ferruginibacter sp.]